MKSKIEKIIYFIIVIVSSIIFADYSLYFIGITQLKMYEKVILFTLYLIMGLGIFYHVIIKKQLFKKIIEGKISKYIIVFSVALSIIVIGTFEKSLIIPTPRNVDLTVTALGEKSEQSMGSEVWITDIKKANGNIDLLKIPLTEGWSIKDGCLLAATNKPSTINISLYVDNTININFVKHNYSGKVKIVQNQQERIVDLYESNGGTYTYTIEPNGQVEYYQVRLIEVAYLLIMLIIVSLLYIAKKKNNEYGKNLLEVGRILSYSKQSYIIVIILAIFTASIYDMPNMWEHEKNDIVLEVLGDKNQNALAYDVWLQSVDVDGKDIDLKKYENKTWIYQEDGKLIGISNRENILRIEVKQKESIGINFLKGIYSGMVKVTYNGKTDTYDLYSQTNSIERVNYSPNKVTTNNSLSDIMMLGFTIIIYVIIYLMFLDSDRKNKALIVSVTISNLVTYGIVATYRIVDIWEIIFASIVSVLFIYHGIGYLRRRKEKFLSEVIWKPIYEIYNFLFVICILISFTFNVGLPNLTSMGKVILFLVALIVGMIICREIEILFLRKKLNHEDYNKEQKRNLIIRGIVPISITSLIYFIGCYPGFMTSDSIDQWGQMLSGNYKDAHPVFHTLFNKVCTLIWLSPAAISLIQSIIFILICAYGIKVLIECKVPQKIIYLVICIFILNPVYHLMNVTLWKDIMYSNMVFIYTLYIIKIVTTDFGWLSKKRNVLMFILINLGVLLFRYNGASVVVSTAFFTIIFFYKRWIKVTTIYAIIGTIFIIIIGPVYSTFGIESSLLSTIKAEKVPYSEIKYHNISYIMLKNGNITTDEIEEINKIRDIDELKSKYSKYNTLNMKADDSVVNLKYLKDNAEHYNELYNNIVSRNRMLVLQNTMNLKSYLWQAMQPVDGYLNLAPVNVIYENEYGLKINPISNTVNTIITKYFIASENGQIISLVWRPIIQLLLIILAAIIIVQKTNFKKLLIIVPVLGNWAGLLLTVNFQDFRYMYCVMLILPIMIGMIFIENKNICKQ